MANTISISILGDVKDISRKLGNVDSKLSGFGKSMKRIGFVAAGAFAAIGGAAVFKDVISGASDLNETVSKTEQIFGKNAEGIKAWADTAATSLGLSKQAALDGASTFGNFFNQIGFGTKEAEKLSKGFVQMSVDLGSFNNADPAQVMDALASATRGEYDALQKYIPTINAAAVQTEAMRLTGKKSVDQLTEQDKALALNSLALKGQGKAAGDFARTSDGLANKQKILAAKVQNLKDKLGSVLLPIMTKVTTFVSDTVLPKFEEFSDWFQKKALPVLQEYGQKFADVLVPALKTAGEFITGTLVPGFQSLVGWIQQNQAWISPLVVAIVAMVAAWKTFTIVMTIWSAVTKVAAAVQTALNIAMSLNPIGIIILAIIGLIAAIVYLWKTNEGFREIVKKVWNAIKGFVLGVINWFKTDVPAAWNAVKNKTVAIWNAVKTFISNAWNAIKTGVSNAVSSVVNFVKGKWDYFKAVNAQMWNIVKDKINSIWTAIKTGVKNAVTNVVDTVKGIKDKVVGFFSGAGRWLWDAGKRIIQGLIDGVTNMVQSLKDKFSSITNLIPDWKGPANKDAKLLYKAGQLIMGGLVKGIDDKTKNLKSTLRDVTSLVQGTDVGSVGGGAIDLALAGSGRGLGASVRPVEITVVALDPTSASEAVVDAIRQYERVNGSGWRS